MNHLITVFLFGFLVFNSVDGGVIKKTKSSVSFQGIGKFTIEDDTKIEGMQKRNDSKSELKGKGLVGGITAKLILKPGNDGEIIDLNNMQIIKIDHKKKEYEIKPIEKISISDYEHTDSGEGESQAETEDREEAHNDIKIIRSEFKVEKSGEMKKINSFSCEKYTVLWLTEWENTTSGQTGTDSLFTVVWTTGSTEDLENAQIEESSFNQAYMKSIGLDMNETQQQILGTNWLSMFQAMNQQNSDNRKKDTPDIATEMTKLEGYPIVIDGNYYALRPGGDKQEEEQEEESKDVKGLFGGFAKKLLKKDTEKDNKLEPAFSYFTEIVKIKLTNIDTKEFDVPQKYKQKQ